MSRHSMMPYLCAAALALAGSASASDINATATYGGLAAPQAGCTFGDGGETKGRWREADGETFSAIDDRGITTGARFAPAVQASALRVVLNRDALRNLQTVAVEDDQGAWRTVWSKKPPANIAAALRAGLIRRTSATAGPEGRRRARGVRARVGHDGVGPRGPAGPGALTAPPPIQ